jgi:methyl-accepting chemotaxis protein
MEIFKEITSSLRTNTNRVFERPIRFDPENLSKLKAPKLRELLTKMDQFCDEVISRNQSIFSENQVLNESLENQKEKFVHLVKINSQMGESINQQALLNSSSKLVCESIMQIFENNPGELAELRKTLKIVSKKKEIVKGKEEECSDEEDQMKHVLEAIKKLTLAVEKLYLSRDIKTSL